MMNKLNKGVIFLLVFFAFEAIGQEDSTAYSLEDAKKYALENSYQMQTARFEKDKAKKKVNETTSIGLPQINGGVDYQNYLDIPVSLVPAEFFGGRPGEFAEIKFGLEHNLTAQVQGSQLIFDGSYIVGLQAAKTYVDLSKKELRKNEIQVKDNVTQAYYTVLVAQKNKEIIKESLENLKKTYEETKALYENGLAEEQSVDQLKLTVSSNENTLKRTERQVEIAYKILKYQMGLPVEEKIALSEELEDIIDEVKKSGLEAQDFSYEKHIDFQMAETRERLQVLNLRKEQVAYLPKLNLVASHRQNAQRHDFNFTDSDKDWYPTTIVGVSLSVPIFDSFMKHARIQQARLDLEKSKVMQEQAAASISLRHSQAISEYNNALEEFQMQKENLELAEKIQNKTLIKYKEGMASSIELTQVQNQYLSTQGSYINSMLQLLNAKSELDKVLNNY